MVFRTGLVRTMLAAAALAPVVLPTVPAAEAASGPEGRLVYVTHALSHDIATFRVGQDGSPQRAGELIKTGDGTGPASILFAPDGRTAYVANRTVQSNDRNLWI